MRQTTCKQAAPPSRLESRSTPITLPTESPNCTWTIRSGCCLTCWARIKPSRLDFAKTQSYQQIVQSRPCRWQVGQCAIGVRTLEFGGKSFVLAFIEREIRRIERSFLGTVLFAVDQLVDVTESGGFVESQ